MQDKEIKIQILDSKTKEPVPYASIIFNETNGTVSNEDGIFSYQPNDYLKNLQVFSLGYENLTVEPEEIKDETIFLIPATIELGEVFLLDENLEVEEILEKVKERVEENHLADPSKKRIFFRQSDYNLVRNFDLHVDKSTIEGIDQNLMNRISNEVPKVSDSYKEVLGDFYGAYSPGKLQIIKAANLNDPRSTQSLTALTDHLEMLFKKNLKKKSYLKIRSGIVGFKVSAKELEEELAAESEESTEDESEKPIAEQKKDIQESTSGKLNQLLSRMFWHEDSEFDLLKHPGRYDLKLEGVQNLKGRMVYIIRFDPERRADFKGKIYIDAEDYGVHRLVYENVKPLKKFRLFGISTSDDLHKGHLIFYRDHNKYNLRFFEQEKGESVGVDRPLTIIEKNKFVPGRRKQNELDLDILLKVSQIQKLQLLVYDEERGYANIPEISADFEYGEFKKYNPSFWSGNDIMEPNEAIQSFSAETF